MPLFTLRSVTTRRGDDDQHVHPLLDVDAVIAPGRVTAVVGPSGAGKSTLLRLLNRMEEPARGSVLFHGRPLPSYDVLELRRRVGLLAQRPTPFPGSVTENLRIGRPDLDEEAALGLLDRVGLGRHFARREATELSGGEAQRVCLARTLAVGPEVLLLDEPTSALDAFAGGVIERVIDGLRADGLAVVLVSHDLRQARRLADDVVVLEAGRVMEQGAATVVFSAARDPSARRFLAGT